MHNIWFTADSHYSHKNILKYCKRPFKSVMEMDVTLVQNWNKVVKPQDVVYHLGDFAFSENIEYTQKFINKLNGSIHLIKGNHDKSAILRAKFASIHDIYELKVGNGIILCHYPMKTWNKSHYGSWHLYGHCHGLLKDDEQTWSTDVGVDRWNYRPVHIDEIAELFSNRENKLLLRKDNVIIPKNMDEN